MRTCVVGGGLAGAVLAWRLAGEPGCRVDLVLGGPEPGPDNASDHLDATTVSAGAVRAYEPTAVARRLATDSLCELLDSAVLRRWSGYHECGFTYLRRLRETGDPAGTAAEVAAAVAAAVAEIERVLPGSVRVASARELAAAGWSREGEPAAAVVERRAGHVFPDRWRRAVVADLRSRRGVTVHPRRAISIRPLGQGTVMVGLGPGAGERGERGELQVAYDLVVVAAGAWTGRLLRACDLSDDGLSDDRLRTKAIQYVVHEAGGWRRSGFVDETTGLYGRDTHDGGLLLGLPTSDWDVPAGSQRLDPDLRDRAAEVARRTFPGLWLGGQRWWVSVADCYTDPPRLDLRPVPAAEGAVFTFTGGSGGSIKSVLAATALAAGELTGRPAPVHVHGYPPSPARPLPTRSSTGRPGR